MCASNIIACRYLLECSSTPCPMRMGRSTATGACKRCLCESRIVLRSGLALSTYVGESDDATQLRRRQRLPSRPMGHALISVFPGRTHDCVVQLIPISASMLFAGALQLALHLAKEEFLGRRQRLVILKSLGLLAFDRTRSSHLAFVRTAQQTSVQQRCGWKGKLPPISAQR